MRERQDLEEAGAWRFGFIDAICERSGRFAKNAVGECPTRQGREIVVGVEFGEDVLCRIGVWAGGGQEVERRHWHAAIELVLSSWLKVCL